MRHNADAAAGDGAADVSLNPDDNLISRVAIYVLRCHDVTSLPAVHVRIVNPIPLGRGLGSSVRYLMLAPYHMEHALSDVLRGLPSSLVSSSPIR